MVARPKKRILGGSPARQVPFSDDVTFFYCIRFIASTIFGYPKYGITVPLAAVVTDLFRGSGIDIFYVCALFMVISAVL